MWIVILFFIFFGHYSNIHTAIVISAKNVYYLHDVDWTEVGTLREHLQMLMKLDNYRCYIKNLETWFRATIYTRKWF